MIEHLLVSTVVLATALLAARVLPLTARTRYALLCLGVAKFAVPTAVFQLVPAEIVPVPLRVFGGGDAGAPVALLAPPTSWTPIIWATVAALLLARWLFRRSRTIHAALRTTTPPSERELRALQDADVAAELVRSPLCEAPAVLRVFRPVIAIPAAGCDNLDDDELRSLLLHEGAHIARHDNVVSFAQALATSLLWFHPLVWMASHAISAAREEACDEIVADRMRGTDAYVCALDKLCHAIAASHTAGASCMAGANVKKRIRSLMRYDTRKERAWLQRAILTAAFIGIALSTLAAPQRMNDESPYELYYSVDEYGADKLVYHLQVVQGSRRVAPLRNLIASPGETATVRYGVELPGGPSLEFFVEARGTIEDGKLRFRVTENGEEVQDQSITYHGEPWRAVDASVSMTEGRVSFDLKGTDVFLVLFGVSELAGLDLVVEEYLKTPVTMKVDNMPWPEVLQRIAREYGLRIELEGKKLKVSKQ